MPVDESINNSIGDVVMFRNKSNIWTAVTSFIFQLDSRSKFEM